MKKRISVAEAKATFSECVRRVESGSSKRCKPVVARPDDTGHDECLKKFGPGCGLVSIAGGWEGADELVQILEKSSRTGKQNISALGK